MIREEQFTLNSLQAFSGCGLEELSRTRSRLRLYVSGQLDPTALQAKLTIIAEYTRAGFTGAGELVAAMKMGGHGA